MSRSILNSSILPLLILPPLAALAAKYIWIEALPLNLKELLRPRCLPGTPFAIAYTHVPAIDQVLCNLVSVFSAVLEKPAFPYAEWLGGQLTPLPAFTFLEAGRSGRSFLLSAIAVTIFGYGYQRYTAGVILHVYWLFFLLTGQTFKTGRLSSSYAYATIFATVVGYIVPTVMMLVLREPYSTAFWQPFPLWMFVLQRIALLILPAGDNRKPGGGAAQLLYAICFASSALPHLHALWTQRADAAALIQLVAPSLAGPPDSADLVEGVKNFLQWDGVFIFASAFVVTLWFARSVKELLVIILWNVVGSALVGPGAALSALYAWREAHVTIPQQG